MLFTISTTHRPATDLARMLGQDPDAIRIETLPTGSAMVCVSQADEQRCTVAVMLQHPGQPARPSLLADALASLFEPPTSDPALPMALEVETPVLSCPGGPERLWGLFGPLGYHLTTTAVDGGAPDELAVKLTAEVPLADLLSHLCSQLRALDGEVKTRRRRTRSAATAHQ